MLPNNCPAWEYDKNKKWASNATAWISELIADLASGRIDTLATAVDTRKSHRRIFEAVTPPMHTYYAGHYRGEHFPCLRYYAVRVEGDPRVGAPPQSVIYFMGELASQIQAAISAMDANAILPATERLRYLVILASRVFVTFLTIHPYANGNGHAGRLIVWAILGRYGYWPKHWPVHPRPSDDQYLQAIARHRSGDTASFEQYLLRAIIGPKT